MNKKMFERHENLDTEEARIKHKLLSNEYSQWFCPLINNECRKDCASYCEPVYFKQNDKYTVVNAGCSSVSVTGYVNVYS